MNKISNDFSKQIEELKNTILYNLNNCNKVFIFPHNEMDFDALASAVAISDICNYFGIDNYIVTNDRFVDNNSSMSSIFLDLRDKYNFVNSNTFNSMNDDKDLLIITDTCATNLLPVDINSYKNEKIVIDHHNPDDRLIKSNNLFINTEACSASEILFYLMKDLGIYISEETCQLLLTGIYLDTNGLKYMHNQSGIISYDKLLDYGADEDTVKNLILVSKSEKQIVDELINNHTIYHDYQGRTFAIAFNKRNPDMIYTNKQLSCACEMLLDSFVDVAFVIGHVKNETNNDLNVAVKARSKLKPDSEDVSAIMQIFDGGGDTYRAACKLDVPNLPSAKDQIKMILKSSPEKRCKEYFLSKKTTN